mmetsp:Transcript_105834/g.158393  ORF Transcript_105834/g.158393 Transcript_105834/m.158393 type:complete len:121 (+) Transcript_105834:1040-1402(+)
MPKEQKNIATRARSLSRIDLRYRLGFPWMCLGSGAVFLIFNLSHFDLLNGLLLGRGFSFSVCAMWFPTGVSFLGLMGACRNDGCFGKDTFFLAVLAAATTSGGRAPAENDAVFCNSDMVA